MLQFVPRKSRAGNMGREEETDVAGGSEPAAKTLVVSRSKPPTENPEAVRLRGWVIFSFWAVVLFLGLPVWWWTTSIHRARLPLRQMNDWADGKVRRPRFSFISCADFHYIGLQTYLPSTNCHRGTVTATC